MTKTLVKSVLNPADSGLTASRPFDPKGLWNKYGGHQEGLKAVYVQGGRMYSETGKDLLEEYRTTLTNCAASDPRRKMTFIDWVHRSGYIVTTDLRSLMVAQQVEEIQRAKYQALREETEKMRKQMMKDTVQELEAHAASIDKSFNSPMFVQESEEIPGLELTEAEKAIYATLAPKAEPEFDPEWVFQGDGLEDGSDSKPAPRIVKFGKKKQ